MAIIHPTISAMAISPFRGEIALIDPVVIPMPKYTSLKADPPRDSLRRKHPDQAIPIWAPWLWKKTTGEGALGRSEVENCE